MDTLYKSFFALLRSGLWNREPESECFPLSPEMWEKVYILARKQTVEGIVYDGILRLPDAHLPPKDLILRWIVVIDALEKRNQQMNKVIGEMNDEFTTNHITAFLTKGQGVAVCYPNPLRRRCGDIDWSFSDKQTFEKAYERVRKRGIPIERQAGFSAGFVLKDFMIEYHRYLLDISNPFVYKYLKELQHQEFIHSGCLEVYGKKVLLPSPVLSHLTVNSHILKHLLSFGISFRQLCDSARVYHAYHQCAEIKQMQQIYRKLGIYRWVQLLNNLLVNYLGMPEEYLPFPLKKKQKADWMMMDILKSGNFGFYGSPFSKEKDEPQIKRKFVWLQLSVRFVRYVQYAPWEAIWFPLVHTFSHLKNKISR
ncbi:MAG: nucleotidyltransferase family protein [Tannerella sp.]|jgi:hypothetical protein|nr:nucleotidyltransferase family protein [Tannerella sp.]